MKMFPSLLASLCIGVCSLSAHITVAAPTQQQQQITMLLSMMENMGQLDSMSACVGLPKPRIKELFSQSITACGMGDILGGEGGNLEHETCMKEFMLKSSGVSAARLEACSDGGGEDNDPMGSELDAIYDRIGDREPTAAEKKEIQSLIQGMTQRSTENIDKVVGSLIEASQGAEDSVTLPIYPQAKMLINLPSPGAMFITEEAMVLPGASFYSTDSPEKVRAFYQKKLPTFKVVESTSLSVTGVALMKSIPPNFEYGRDFEKAFSIEHVLIQEAPKTNQNHLVGAKTLFFIYYQPKK